MTAETRQYVGTVETTLKSQEVANIEEAIKWAYGTLKGNSWTLYVVDGDNEYRRVVGGWINVDTGEYVPREFYTRSSLS